MKHEFLLLKNSVHISRETLYLNYKDHWSVPFMEIIPLNSGNRTERINTVCGQRTEAFNVKPWAPHSLKTVDFNNISLFTDPIGLYWAPVRTLPYGSVGRKPVSTRIIPYCPHFYPEDRGNIYPQNASNTDNIHRMQWPKRRINNFWNCSSLEINIDLTSSIQQMSLIHRLTCNESL
jgi:hypothetical protein